ncbi:MAG: SRPBCC family protein [Kineosporiaceae bacterium]|jgi:acetyl-CoA C-acetyltransferase
MSVTSRIEVAADPAAVWAVVSDLTRLGEWSPSHLGLTGPAPSPVVEGSEYTEKLRVLGMPNEIRWTVSTLEPGRRIVQDGQGPMGISVHGEYIVEASGDGAVVTLEQSFSGATLVAIRGQLEREVQGIQDTALERLRELLTAG